MDREYFDELPRQLLVCALCPRIPTRGTCENCGRMCCRGCIEDESRQCWQCLGYVTLQGYMEEGGGRKRGARDSEGDGGRPTRGLGLAREGAACGHGARMPSRCGRCCVRRDGLAWSGRCVNGRWRGGGRQGGCRRQGTGGSGWRRQGGWRSCGGWHLKGRFGGEERIPQSPGPQVQSPPQSENLLPEDHR